MKSKIDAQTIISFCSVIIAVITIFSTIINDRIINNRSLSIILASELPLVNDKEILNDMEINYKGKKIQNLYKANFYIINDGNTSFTSNDVIETISLVLPETSTILYIDKNRSIPDSLKVSTIPNSNKINISFSLLNKDDYYEFAVYYTGNQIISFSTEGRIKDLKDIKHSDHRISQIEKPKKKANWITWTLGVFCGLLLLVLLTSIKDLVIHKNIKKELLDKDITFIKEKYKLTTKANIVSFIQSKMNYIPDNQKKELDSYIENNEIEKLLKKIEVIIPQKAYRDDVQSFV
jgi:hypothetical protein